MVRSRSAMMTATALSISGTSGTADQQKAEPTMPAIPFRVPRLDPKGSLSAVHPEAVAAAALWRDFCGSA